MDITDMSISPLNILIVAKGRPMDVWMVSPPTRMPPKKIDERITTKGFNLASHATIIAVYP